MLRIFEGGGRMPLLDYRCKACGLQFDELVNEANRDKVACPKCGSRELSQVFAGKCLFGPVGGGSGCSGNCSCCKGCHH